jgi:hypothetical protein
MSTQEQQTIFLEIEKYIRDTVAKNGGSFHRDTILIQSKEWMEKYPVEFNSILNMIENEGISGGSDFMDDSTPSVHNGGGYADDSTPSVHYSGEYADDSTPSIHYSGGYADDYMSSVHYDGGINAMDESHSEYRKDDPMGSDEVDSSPNGNADDDEIESYIPLQRTMSSIPLPVNKKI